MGLISTYFNNKELNGRADLLVNTTSTYLRQKRHKILNEILPTKQVKDNNIIELIVDQKIPIASIVSAHGRFPIFSFQELQKRVGEMLYVGIGMTYSQKTQEALYKAIREADLRGIQVYDTFNSDGKVTQEGTNNDLIEILFGTLTTLVKQVEDAVLYHSYQILETGKLQVKNDVRANIPSNKVLIDYTNPKYPELFPPALTATGSPDKITNVWTDYQNSDPLGRIMKDMETYRTINSQKPKYIIMNESLLYHMLRSYEFGKQVAYLKGISTFNSVIPQQDVENIFNSYKLPNLVVVNDQVDIQLSEDETEFKRTDVVSPNRYTFATERMGTIYDGVVFESIMKPMTGGNFNPQPKPGIHYEVVEQSTVPNAVDLAYAKKAFLTTIPDSKKLFSRQVV